ncbi:oligopeptide transport system permease protein [Clostridium tetanomorphum]|uniref:ABC transporter permease n=1 Tax=Clostridium tetanomorphum TaxID=1553 RepID=A0A923J0E5_CLOTT|nr:MULTISPECIES: ABC transporter permease [Clostridium]KAJ52760.1 oligopeptide/dipeptide ABC transporter permease [Clostridium tetanomorphum DSM 665]MBC2398231.1 ABC transporter permease [Clostridium tetanomorphum]MBC2425510.1 ABC transporter permease [Clostridium beijerinckii]MBP1865650.1 oligopeptide transport system permease protein [Clostridium tetanomorphum]NRS85844.1 oligopeptide transport system permease protein [Clostridium tetanomorphum]
MVELNKGKFEIIGCGSCNADAIVRPNMTYWQDAWRRLKKNKIAIFSLILLGVIALMCAVGPYIGKMLSGVNYWQQNTDITNQKPGGQFIFGTDNLGRDMFSRLWIGGRVSIAIGIFGTLIEVTIGAMYGGISGYFGGLIDEIMMRIVEILNSIPYMIVVILIAVVMQKQGIATILLALCLTGWTGMARLIRGQVMQLKESEYVLAAQALGADSKRIIAKHLIPNTIGIIIIYMTFDIPGFIFAEAFLSFIGLGIQPPNTSWGAMCSFGQSVMQFYPHELLFPAIAISLTMLSFNLLGDGLRDALDPKLRQ